MSSKSEEPDSLRSLLREAFLENRWLSRIEKDAIFEGLYSSDPETVRVVEEVMEEIEPNKEKNPFVCCEYIQGRVRRKRVRKKACELLGTIVADELCPTVVTCLTGDTPVLMADGSLKPVSEIAQGDTVISALSNECTFTDEVAHIFINDHSSVISLTLSTDETLVMSESQPIMSVSGPVTAGALFDDAKLVQGGADGLKSTPIGFVKKEIVEFAQPQPLYSLHTKEGGFFFIGQSALSVKCKGGPYGPPPRYLPK